MTEVTHATQAAKEAARTRAENVLKEARERFGSLADESHGGTAELARDVIALLDECSRLREELYEKAFAYSGIVGSLQEALAVAEGALEVYADWKHWAIRRNGTMYPDCIWIGPGATDRVNPDGPGIARAALEGRRDGI